MINADPADLYQLTTGNLNLAVKRNLDRFPEDFMFQLTREEFVSLRFQSAISNRGRPVLRVGKFSKLDRTETGQRPRFFCPVLFPSTEA
jgi:hypothetical protein